MIFKEENKVVYCKDDYHEEFDNNKWYNDNKCYYKGYLVHREDGPAKEWNDGSKIWYIDGKRHREDGPACEYNGCKYWWLNGKKFSEKEYFKIINLKKKSRVLDEV